MKKIDFSLVDQSNPYSLWFRRIAGGILAIMVGLSLSAYTVIQSKINALKSLTEAEERLDTHLPQLEPFPISVDPKARLITTGSNDEYVQKYFQEHISSAQNNQWFDRLLARVSQWGWYQNLATPDSRILIILPGERKEEIADNFAKILNWDTDKQKTFLQNVTNNPPAFAEGTFAPGQYVVRNDASPQYVARLVQDKFARTVLSRYPNSLETQVPLHDTLILASILERESNKFTEMRVISGIIWNRIFINMPLQIDATLQYVKVSDEGNINWWPVPKPADKYIDSPFNTYQNKGLPPTPISNPELASILAALNPIDTQCLYYFHDRQSNFHCSATYQGHIDKLTRYYGQGR